ncbi:MAG: phage terminase large subunit [Bacillaceae bacterium]|nr:phage terminase large subunit [Bacillaceae bacterium]
MRTQTNKVYIPAMDSKHLVRLFQGSSGSGKSRFLAQETVLRMIDPTLNGCSHLIVSTALSDLKDRCYAEIESVVNEMGLDGFTFKRDPMEIIYEKNNTVILFRGSFDRQARQRLKSVNVKTYPNAKYKNKLCFIWCEEFVGEASGKDPEIHELMLDRLRGKHDNPNAFYQISYTYNPCDVKSYLKSLWEDVDNPNIYRLKTTYKDNAWIDEGTVKRREWEKIHDPDRYLRVWFGRVVLGYERISI